jgi:cation:H+ antiporter
MIILALVFVVSLFFLVFGADLFLKSAEKIGLSMGLSPFVVGVTIVAFGTSFPELFTAVTAAFMNVTELIPASAIGSNIANILLVVGISAVIGKKLVVTKNLIDIDLPLLAIGTVILIGVVYPWGDKDTLLITRAESAILLLTYGAYLLYTFSHKEDEEDHLEKIPTRRERRKHIILKKESKVLKVTVKDWLLLVLGGVFLAVSANYLVSSVIEISSILKVGVGVISILAVAIGTSLPELVVSAKAALKGKPEVALGNVFGSNVFNSFVVIGIPGIFKNIEIDEVTFSIGFPIMILSTLLFVISGISRRIHNWEGIFFLALYVIFTAKILSLF